MSDPRFGDLIRTDVAAATKGDIVIIGIPTDEGIRRNGGRDGAAQAPDEIRKYFRKLTPVSTIGDPDHEIRQIFDHGNITGSTLEEIHSVAKQAIQEYITRGSFVISLGGGHDVTYPLVSGASKAIGKPLGLINVDAHLDVRQKKNGLHHSGSSFRLLIEDGMIDPKQFIEFGIQPFSAAKDHIDWTLKQGSRIVYSDDTKDEFATEIGTFTSNWYLSFDIDSIRSADAPGCSAPSPIGFFAEDAIRMCYHAANSKELVAMDIVEVSPPFDKDGRTSRLAARMMAAIITGLE